MGRFFRFRKFNATILAAKLAMELLLMIFPLIDIVEIEALLTLLDVPAAIGGMSVNFV